MMKSACERTVATGLFCTVGLGGIGNNFAIDQPVSLLPIFKTHVGTPGYRPVAFDMDWYPGSLVSPTSQLAHFRHQ